MAIDLTRQAEGWNISFIITTQLTSKNPLPAIFTVAAALSLQASGAIKVFFLAGQSNMVGYGRVETGRGGAQGSIGSLRHLVEQDPEQYGHLVEESGDWVVRDDVWVWARQSEYIYQPPGSRDFFTTGNLTAGFGHDAHSNRTALGPELGLGHVLGDFHEDQVVLIKAAWGGASLAVNFRPPTAVADRGGSVGAYYTLMFEAFEDALADIEARYPGEDIEFAGFAWHQGWSDRVNASATAEYEENLADFIVDVRTALEAPALPFVIGETGQGGPDVTDPQALAVMAAQENLADPAQYPGFAGNVGFAATQEFWRPVSESPRDVIFHWNDNGETYYLIGEAMGHAMTDLLAAPPAGPRPEISGLEAMGEGVWELTLQGEAETPYEFWSSSDLDFETDAAILLLSQENPGTDPGTVTNGTLLTTDGAGLGKVRVLLPDEPRAFLRARLSR